MSADYLTKARLRELNGQLSGRDLAAVRRVSELRYVTGTQLSRLHFDGMPARTAREALLRLNRLGLMERLPRSVGGVRAGSAGYVYRLGQAGQQIATERDWQRQPYRRAHVPGTRFVCHALQVAELHTLLTEADRSRRIELLEIAAEHASQRRYNGPVGRSRLLKPDSYVRLGVGEYEDSYFIEVDMGTEGSRALDSKLRQYVEYEATGQEQAERGVFPKTLWLAPDTERAQAITACIERLPHSTHALFAVAPFADLLDVVTDTPLLTNTQHEGVTEGVK